MDVEHAMFFVILSSESVEIGACISCLNQTSISANNITQSCHGQTKYLDLKWEVKAYIEKTFEANQKRCHFISQTTNIMQKNYLFILKPATKVIKSA